VDLSAQQRFPLKELNHRGKVSASRRGRGDYYKKKKESGREGKSALRDRSFFSGWFNAALCHRHQNHEPPKNRLHPLRQRRTACCREGRGGRGGKGFGDQIAKESGNEERAPFLNIAL